MNFVKKYSCTLTKKIHLNRSQSNQSLHASINNSKNKLFFISYTPVGTLKYRWYLVQLDIESMEELKHVFQPNNEYYCVFIAKKPTDRKKEMNTADGGPIGTNIRAVEQ